MGSKEREGRLKGEPKADYIQKMGFGGGSRFHSETE